MMKIIDKYVAKQAAFACLLATVVLSGPVVLVTLLKSLPSDAVFTELFWPTLYGITCMVLYVSLPVPISIAIVWTYSRLASDSTLTIFHCVGISTLGVRAPAFVVAVCGAVLGYAMSNFLAPHSANNIHDMLFALRHEIIPALLQEGKFNEFDRGRQVLYFSKRVSNTELSDVFIREVTDDQEVKAYRARWAAFVRNADESWIVLHDGSMQTMDPSRSEVRTVAFDQVVRPATRSGDPKPRRGYVFYDELVGGDFLRAAPSAFDSPNSSREWAQEAVKRFGFPALAIIHTLLGLELLAVWGGLNDRLRHPTASICALIMALHFAIAVTAENVSRFNAGFAWVVVMMMIAELAAAAMIGLLRSGRLTTAVELRDPSGLPADTLSEPIPEFPGAPMLRHRTPAFRDRTADWAVIARRFSSPELTYKSSQGTPTADRSAGLCWHAAHPEQ